MKSEIDLTISARTLRLVRRLTYAYRPTTGNWYCGRKFTRHSASRENISLWMSPLRRKAWKVRADYPRGGAHCDSGLIITTQLVRNLPALLNWCAITASRDFQRPHRLRHHDHHQIFVNADWRAGSVSR